MSQPTQVGVLRAHCGSTLVPSRPDPYLAAQATHNRLPKPSPTTWLACRCVPSWCCRGRSLGAYSTCCSAQTAKRMFEIRKALKGQQYKTRGVALRAIKELVRV